jgi:hypothetical protein
MLNAMDRLGDCQETLYRATDLQGSDLIRGGLRRVFSAHLCCNYCAMEPKCQFFTYSPKKKRCWLKDSESGEEEQDDRVSGSVQGNGVIADVPAPPKRKTYNGM